MVSRGSGERLGASEEASAGEYQSPCLKLLFDRLQGGGRHLILDLGPAVGDNVQFFAQLSCKLFIADLYESLFAPATRQPDGLRTFRRLLQSDLPSTDGQPIDLILAWDLLNYLEPEYLRVLAQSLSPYCHRGTQLFAMVATHKEMPARPTVFRIRDYEHLIFRPDEQWRRPSPRYNEADLVRSMPGFEVDVSFLLRIGFQEYLLSYRPSGGGGEATSGAPGRGRQP